jgi:hypothetical protein
VRREQTCAAVEVCAAAAPPSKSPKAVDRVGCGVVAGVGAGGAGRAANEEKKSASNGTGAAPEGGTAGSEVAKGSSLAVESAAAGKGSSLAEESGAAVNDDAKGLSFAVERGAAGREVAKGSSLAVESGAVAKGSSLAVEANGSWEEEAPAPAEGPASSLGSACDRAAVAEGQARAPAGVGGAARGGDSAKGLKGSTAWASSPKSAKGFGLGTRGAVPLLRAGACVARENNHHWILQGSCKTHAPFGY